MPPVPPTGWLLSLMAQCRLLHVAVSRRPRGFGSKSSRRRRSVGDGCIIVCISFQPQAQGRQGAGFPHAHTKTTHLIIHMHTLSLPAFSNISALRSVQQTLARGAPLSLDQLEGGMDVLGVVVPTPILISLVFFVFMTVLILDSGAGVDIFYPLARPFFRPRRPASDEDKVLVGKRARALCRRKFRISSENPNSPKMYAAPPVCGSRFSAHAAAHVTSSPLLLCSAFRPSLTRLPMPADVTMSVPQRRAVLQPVKEGARRLRDKIHDLLSIVKRHHHRCSVRVDANVLQLRYIGVVEFPQ